MNPRVGAKALGHLLGTPDAERPAYAWLRDGVRQLIANGHVLHDTTLPSERELVAALGMSRTTVARAYAELRELGYARARVGSGTVARIPGGPVTGGTEPLLSGGQPVAEGVVDMTSAAPCAPVGIIAYYQRAMEQLPAYTRSMGYFSLGIPPLREAIAEDYTRRGVATSPDQIIVTAGALAAVGIVARTVLTRGQRVLAESPSYPNAIASLKRCGARLIAVPITPAGSDLDAITAGLRGSDAKAMLCAPDHHNPVGTLLDNAGRERWAAELTRADTLGIVDETGARLWLDARPDVLPMAAFSANLVCVGSASKSHWGGLRLGWIRAPQALMGALTSQRMSMDLGTPVLEQLVLAMLLRERPGLDETTRQSLRGKRDWLIAELSRQLPSWRVSCPPGGLSLWCNLPQAKGSLLAQQVRGVRLAPGPHFAVDGHSLEHWLRLPYALPREALARALPPIVAAWHAVAG